MQAVTDEQAKNAILTEFASKIYMPYIIMSVVLVLLEFWRLRSSLPEIKSTEAIVQTVSDDVTNEKSSLFQFLHLWLGAICIFFNVAYK